MEYTKSYCFICGGYHSLTMEDCYKPTVIDGDRLLSDVIEQAHELKVTYDSLIKTIEGLE